MLNYYKIPCIDTLPESIQPEVFDIAVNLGPNRAIKILQKVINLAGFGPVDVDGKLGPETRKCAISALEKMGNYLVNAIADERVNFYNHIVEADSSQEFFLKDGSTGLKALR